MLMPRSQIIVDANEIVVFFETVVSDKFWQRLSI